MKQFFSHAWPGRLVFVGWLLLMVLLALDPASAQMHPARIGYIGGGAVWGDQPSQVGLMKGLREQGLVEGRDFTIEFRSTAGDPARQIALAEELVRLPVDLFLVPVCGEPLNSVRRLTQTIPIVVLTCNEDMVASGLIRSMNRPGGNITGQSKLTPQLAAKRLELLREILPSARRVAVLWNPGYSAFAEDWQELRSAARKLGFTLDSVEFRRGTELDAAFRKINDLHVDALMCFSDSSTYVLSKQIAERAAAVRLPSVFAFREIPDAGGMMSYGPNIVDMFRNGAGYVARILRGASPAELPIEMPMRFELIINLRAAAALGIKVPDQVLLRADEVIR